MKNINDVLPLVASLVKEISEQINLGILDLMDAESKILEFINKIGHLMLTEVVEKIGEPVVENQVIINGKKAYYRNMQNLRFKNRFGNEIIHSRRSYAIEGGSKGYYPLDEKLGMDKCRGFSPLMTYLQSLFAADIPYANAANKLSKAVGFPISATAVQNNTEMTGARLEGHPFKAIPDNKQHEACDLLVVEIDGTMSPQIVQKEGVTGRESLKQPTEYKECNIITIQKFNQDKKQDEWIGAQYGIRADFNNYVHQTGLKMGQLKAKAVVFIADGAKHNWDIQMNIFPEAVPRQLFLP